MTKTKPFVCIECKKTCNDSICIKCRKTVCQDCIVIHFKLHAKRISNLILKREFTKKECREIFEFVMSYARVSKMDMTLLLTELIGKNESGEIR